MGRIMVANRHGDHLIEWDPTSTSDEGRAAIAAAERIIAEARAQGCAISKKVGEAHVLDHDPFDPMVEEYQIIAPIVGG